MCPGEFLRKNDRCTPQTNIRQQKLHHIIFLQFMDLTIGGSKTPIVIAKYMKFNMLSVTLEEFF